MSKLGDKLGRLASAMRRPSHAAAHDESALLESTVEPLESESRLVPDEPHDDTRGHKLSQLRAQMEGVRNKLRRERASMPFKRVAPDDSFHDEPTRVLGANSEQGSSALPGELLETELGPLRSVLTRHEDGHCHGSIPVTSALDASSADLAVLALDPTLAAIDFSRALYIDTETTGLAGGAGTIPFLIGMAWFEGRELLVEQLLLERPGLEAPMLTRLSERLQKASAVISYNGKSFDWPLLRTRFILQRVPAPKLPAHLDLLHCSRRVYKRRLGSVRLVNLEEEILGFTRVDDIAGELIPETYLGFVRGHVAGSALVPIVDHNRHDLVALAALMGELTRRFRGEQPKQDARDQLSFAGVAARGDDHARAMSFALAAVEADVRGELAPEAHFLAGEMCARASDWSGAERAYLLSIQAACGVAGRAAKAHLALSKLYEHRLKRPADALKHAHLTEAEEGEAACARRVQRLTKKARLPTACNLELEGF